MGRGTILKTDWTVHGPQDAPSKLGVEAPTVCCGENGFFFPGFIDTHIHASQYPNAGIFGKSTLLDWLTTYTFPLESSFGNAKSPMYKDCAEPPDPLARAKKVYDRVVARTLSHGTTMASYFATIHVEATNALADICLKRGQRALVGRVCMTEPSQCPEYYCDESPEDGVKKTKESVSYCRQVDPEGIIVQPIVTPRFAPSCTKGTLDMLGRLVEEENLKVQTHVSENLKEVKLVKEMFPNDESYVGVYDTSGLLTDRTILAHAVHLSKAEMTLVKSRNAKISHCPASNSALGSGFCTVRDYLDQGIEVGLGTDMSGGFSLSILEAVREACFVSRDVGFVNDGDSRFNVGVTESLWLGTVGGASVVGMKGKLGGFEEGMFWDVQEIDLVEYDVDDFQSTKVDIFGWETWEERVDKWVWNGDDRNVKRVWVGGRLVHERR